MAKIDFEKHVFRSPKLKSVVKEAIKFFEVTPVYELPPPGRFDGVGVYALYYLGGFKPYSKIARKNSGSCTYPVYVGKAVPTGWRTARSKESKTPVLYRRLREHAKSIQQVESLLLGDFRCRFVILGGIESDLVVPLEAELIRRHKPLWNSTVDGFGNHDPGAGRYEQARSEWDILHPGRTWAQRLKGKSPSLKDVTAQVKKALK